MSKARQIALLISLVALSSPVLAESRLDAFRARRAQQEGTGTGEQSMMGAEGKLKGEVQLPEGARLEKDIAYGKDPQQQLDVYVPKDAVRAPLIFMVHGGAWMIGDKAYLPVVANKVARWLPKGYVLVSVNYRMSRSPNPLDQVDDVARALAYVQSHAASWGADPKRVIVMGHSAGAHLVSLLSSSSTIAQRAGVQPWLGTVSLDSAVLNVPQTMEAHHYRFYDKVFGTDKALWKAASPYHQLSRAPRPMLMVCASGREDSCPQAEAFAAKVRSLGGQATVLPVDMKHGETNSELGTDSAYTAKVETFMRGLGLP